jgi:hypothetical protein
VHREMEDVGGLEGVYGEFVPGSMAVSVPVSGASLGD